MRIGIIGMGWVGSSVAISTLESGVAHELWVQDIARDVAEGEAMDLAQGASFYPHARVEAVETDHMLHADAVVIAAGKGGSPQQSRLDLLRGNAAIARDVGKQLRGFGGLVVVVTNPVDVMTQLVLESSGLPPSRVIGTGTMLDTARLRHALGEELHLDSRSIHAQVIGEHGDSEVPLWSSAHIGGRPLRQWEGWTSEQEKRIGDRVRRAAYEIIRRKGATNHAIGLVTAALLRWTLRSERRVVTVSRLQEGACGVRDVCLSLPAIMGRDGATEIIEPHMDDAERQALHRSAAVLREARAGIESG